MIRARARIISHLGHRILGSSLNDFDSQNPRHIDGYASDFAQSARPNLTPICAPKCEVIVTLCLKILFVLFSNGSVLKGDDIPDVLLLDLISKLTYKDSSDVFIPDKVNVSRFAAEVLDGRVTKATLRGITFSTDELKQFELYRDSKGGLWLKRLVLSGRSTPLLLARFLGNSPPFKPATVPDPLIFDFDTEFLGDGVDAGDSNQLSCRGKRLNSIDYETKIIFRQTQPTSYISGPFG